jgi:hypothetical protein
MSPQANRSATEAGRGLGTDSPTIRLAQKRIRGRLVWANGTRQNTVLINSVFEV